MEMNSKCDKWNEKSTIESQWNLMFALKFKQTKTPCKPVHLMDNLGNIRWWNKTLYKRKIPSSTKVDW